MAELTIDELLAQEEAKKSKLAPKSGLAAAGLAATNTAMGGLLPYAAELTAPIEKRLYSGASGLREMLGFDALPEMPEVNRETMQTAIEQGKRDYPWSSAGGEGGVRAGQTATAMAMGPLAAPWLAAKGAVPAITNSVVSAVGTGAPKTAVDYAKGEKSGTSAAITTGLDAGFGAFGGVLGPLIGKLKDPAKALVAGASKALPQAATDAASRVARAVPSMTLSTPEAVGAAGLLKANPVEQAKLIAQGRTIADATSNIASKTPGATNLYNTMTEKLRTISQGAADDWLTTQPGIAAAGEAAAGQTVKVSGITPLANRTLLDANKVVKGAGTASGDSPLAVRAAQDTLRQQLDAAPAAAKAEIQAAIDSLENLLERKAADYVKAPGIRESEPYVRAGGEAGAAVPAPDVPGLDKPVRSLLEGLSSAGIMGMLTQNPYAALGGMVLPAAARGTGKAVGKRMASGAEDAVEMLLSRPEEALKLFGKRTPSQLHAERWLSSLLPQLGPGVAQMPMWENVTR